MSEKDQSLATINGMAARNESSGLTISPSVDILETDNELFLYADMPGVRPDDVDIRFENGELSVHGRREQTHADKTRIGWETEVTSYYRTFRVTEHIAADKIEADIRSGVLTLRLPKVEAVKPRRITVKSS